MNLFSFKPYLDPSYLLAFRMNSERDTKIDFNGRSAETGSLQTDCQRALGPTRDHTTKPHGMILHSVMC